MKRADPSKKVSRPYVKKLKKFSCAPFRLVQPVSRVAAEHGFSCFGKAQSRVAQKWAEANLRLKLNLPCSMYNSFLLVAFERLKLKYSLVKQFMLKLKVNTK